MTLAGKHARSIGSDNISHGSGSDEGDIFVYYPDEEWFLRHATAKDDEPPSRLGVPRPPWRENSQN